jgi:Uma2 family endonuclease
MAELLAEEIVLRPLTRVEYGVLVEEGFIGGHDEQVELIEGMLVRKPKPHPAHVVPVRRLNRLFTRGLADRYEVGVQDPFVASDDSEPHPDLQINDADWSHLDNPATAYLIVEVSRSRLRFDLGTKARLYALAGVPLYWAIDVDRRVVHVHTRPSPDGYASIVVHGVEDVLEACGVTVVLADLLAPLRT